MAMGKNMNPALTCRGLYAKVGSEEIGGGGASFVITGESALSEGLCLRGGIH
jgi:hypothetical protein